MIKAHPLQLAASDAVNNAIYKAERFIRETKVQVKPLEDAASAEAPLNEIMNDLVRAQEHCREALGYLNRYLALREAGKLRRRDYE